MRHIITPIAGAVVAALALAAILVVPGAAAGKTTLVELRVEGPGRTLDKGTWYVTHRQTVKQGRTPSCKRTPHRDVFEGRNALTLLAGAQDTNRAVRPVRHRPTDFGPQVCQIGDLRSFGTFPDANGGFLYYVNYESGFSSPDVAKVATGDKVLWYYAEFPGENGGSSVNTGCVLQLRGVPAHDRNGRFRLRVVEHGFCSKTGTGFNIVGADSQTELGDGRYRVTVGSGTTALHARRGQDVRSNRLAVCVGEASDCPSAHGRKIVGSNRRDRLPGTKGDDRIRARRGNDRIVIKQGGNDVVKCGRGRDVVIKKRGDGRDRIARNCERVVRR